MTATESQAKNDTEHIKLYSSKAIAIATFLGGPLPAGYLIGENFKALEKPTEGRNSLIVGIIATILLFGGLFMIPEHIIDKIPGQLIPIGYTAIIWGIIEWKQGDVLRAHEASGNSFFSTWRAAGIGLISLIILVIGILGYSYFAIDNELYETYDLEIAKFSANENETLIIYDHLNTENKDILIKELDDIVIPKWKENLEIVNGLNQLEDLPSDLIIENKFLLDYATLRIQAFELLRRSLKEDTQMYAQQLEDIYSEIDYLFETKN